MRGPPLFSAKAAVAPEGAVPAARLALLALLRPAQWVKNLLVFAALIFSRSLFVPALVAKAIAAFACFCALASAAYLVNDVRDVENDRRHPTKRHRPLASGEVSIGSALALALGLDGLALILGFLLGSRFLAVAVGYALLQVAYSTVLKHVVIVDVMALAAGFVLRAAGGGVAIGVEVSPWLIICTFLLALFLGFSKRRHELVLLEGEAGAHRASLREYSPYFLDQMISVVTASTVVAYAFYTVSPEVREKLHTDKLYLTIPFVLYGIFRYLYLVHQREGGGNPTHHLLSDPPLWANVLLWSATAVCLLYAR